jgi:hypothetical protein
MGTTSHTRLEKEMASENTPSQPHMRRTTSKLAEQHRVVMKNDSPNLVFLKKPWLLCGLEGSLKLPHAPSGDGEISQDSGQGLGWKE